MILTHSQSYVLPLVQRFHPFHQFQPIQPNKSIRPIQSIPPVNPNPTHPIQPNWGLGWVYIDHIFLYSQLEKTHINEHLGHDIWWLEGPWPQSWSFIWIDFHLFYKTSTLTFVQRDSIIKPWSALSKLNPTFHGLSDSVAPMGGGLREPPIRNQGRSHFWPHVAI